MEPERAHEETSLSDLLQDLRQTARALMRDRSFTLLAVVLLAIGLAANATIFSVLDAVLLRPLPYPDPGALVHVGELTPEGHDFTTSQPNYLDFRSQQNTLVELGAIREASIVRMDGDRPAQLRGAAASASFFDVMGVRPLFGRTFTAEEDAAGTPARVAVISASLWRRTLAADPRALGTTLSLNGEAYTLVGVMPDHFAMRGSYVPAGTDVWIPLGASPNTDRLDHWLEMVGRLRAGVDADAAARDLSGIAARVAETYPAMEGWSVRVRPLREVLVGETVARSVWVLMGAVGLLLLLACANVANLLLARATARRGETAVRVALGAGRARLARQFLSEAALLAMAGTVFGLVLSLWSLEAVTTMAAGRIPGIENAALDVRAVGFMIALAAFVTLTFGFVPALQSGRLDVHGFLRGGARGGSARAGSRSREGLVVAQVGLAMLLLLGSGLLLRSYLALRGEDPGFTIENVYAVPLEMTEAAYDEYWQVSVFYRGVAERLAALPGVVAAGATTTEPFRSFRFVNDVTPVERAAEVGPAGLLSADWRSVTRGYFEAAQIPLLRGRLFHATDTHEAPTVAVINEALASRLWPGQDAVGRSFFWGGVDGDPIPVVGVVGNVRDFALDEPAPPMLFLSAHQLVMPRMTVLVRTQGPVSGIASAIRSTVWELNPAVAVPTVQRVEDYRSDALAQPRTQTALLLSFAFLALLVAAIGVYALVSYHVALRRRELGIRYALGARPHALRVLVLRRTIVLIVAGVGIGVVAALALGRFVRAILYETAPTDPVSFLVLPLVLGVVALAAAYVPARRGAGVNPLAVLRAD